ncbi:MAG TPA: hypothetical protein VGO31_10495 [Microbacteriaceae bacterium]|jgi:hypothetical protein|nr:hypothetical protein [Microbacteriaceae bacterium]
MSSKWIRGVILAAAVLATAIVWGTGGGVSIAYIKAFVTASGIVTVVVLLFDAWGWRQPGLRRLTRRPVLHGTWRAHLRTNFAERAGEEIECYIVVRQTYSRISVRMLFDRSRSASMSGDLVFEDGACTLYYLFRTEASALHREGNPPARGGAVLAIARKPRMTLEGDYWTERDTRGDVRTLGHTSNLYDTYQDARAARYD